MEPEATRSNKADAELVMKNVEVKNSSIEAVSSDKTDESISESEVKSVQQTNIESGNERNIEVTEENTEPVKLDSHANTEQTTEDKSDSETDSDTGLISYFLDF